MQHLLMCRDSMPLIAYAVCWPAQSVQEPACVAGAPDIDMHLEMHDAQGWRLVL